MKFLLVPFLLITLTASAEAAKRKPSRKKASVSRKVKRGRVIRSCPLPPPCQCPKLPDKVIVITQEEQERKDAAQAANRRRREAAESGFDAAFEAWLKEQKVPDGISSAALQNLRLTAREWFRRGLSVD